MQDTPTLQLIAYSTLTLAGLCVAIVALVFSYRQNFGWKPIVLVTSHGVGGISGEDNDYIAYLDFEFWNRRKYPVVVRYAEVDFGELRVFEKQSESGERETWATFHGKALTWEEERVDPSSHEKFECRAAFKKRSLDSLDVRATIRLLFFDPLAGKQKKMSITHRFSLNAESSE